MKDRFKISRLMLLVAAGLFASLLFVWAACGGDGDGVPRPIPTEALPTAEEGADLSAEEEAYRDELVPLMSDFGSAVGNATDLGSSALADPTLLLGETWFEDLDREQERVRAIESSLEALEPTQRFKKAHEILEGAVSEVEIAIELLENGVRNASRAQIDEGTEHMAEADRLMDAFMGAIESEFGDGAQ
jgi:hypothetical protein